RGVADDAFRMALATNVFPHLHVRSFLEPGLGYIGAETAAVGSIILALALYAIWRRRSAETWFFTALGIFCMLCGARWAPLADALRRLPLLDITLYDRLAFAAALCLAVLAAMGVEEMIRRGDARAVAMTMLVVLALLAFGTWWISRNVVLAITPADYGHARVFAELSFLAAAALVLAARPRFGAVALIALLAAQRIVSEFDTFATFPAKAAFPPIPMLAPLQQIREPFRLVGHATAFPPATGTFYGIEDPRGYEALTLRQFVRTWPLWNRPHGSWYHRVDDLTAPFLSFMNVRFAIQSDALAVPPGWRRIGAQPGAVLLENERALERIFVPARVILSGASDEEIADRMAGIRDFRELAYITASSAGERENGPGSIALRKRSRGGEYVFDAAMQREGFVVVSDSAWKGWRAYVDGRRVRLHRANAAFLGVHVPAGKHTVRLVYRPRSFVIGRTITLATLVGLVAVAALARKGKRSGR
ncbi:MAG TPA: YfhO family protein, partial [Thermoanaerobaculia bacterium]|nr:YfhO family protein [Thermoanaerobaculia bacterium]